MIRVLITITLLIIRFCSLMISTVGLKLDREEPEVAEKIVQICFCKMFGAVLSAS